MNYQRVVTVIALGSALWFGGSALTGEPVSVTGQMMPLDDRVSQVEQRVDSLEDDIVELRDKMTAEPAVSAPPSASATACRDIRTDPVVTSTPADRNGYQTISITNNYNGVQGLKRADVTEGDEVITTYSVPDWLIEAYGGNMTAILRELNTGRLQNQRARANCTP